MYRGEKFDIEDVGIDNKTDWDTHENIQKREKAQEETVGVEYQINLAYDYHINDKVDVLINEHVGFSGRVLDGGGYDLYVVRAKVLRFFINTLLKFELYVFLFTRSECVKPHFFIFS